MAYKSWPDLFIDQHYSLLVLLLQTLNSRFAPAHCTYYHFHYPKSFIHFSSFFASKKLNELIKLLPIFQEANFSQIFFKKYLKQIKQFLSFVRVLEWLPTQFGVHRMVYPLFFFFLSISNRGKSSFSIFFNPSQITVPKAPQVNEGEEKIRFTSIDF